MGWTGVLVKNVFGYANLTRGWMLGGRGGGVGCGGVGEGGSKDDEKEEEARHVFDYASS